MSDMTLAQRAADAFLLIPAQPKGAREIERVLRKTRLLALRTLLQPPRAHATEPARRALVRLRGALEPLIGGHGDEILRAVGSPDVMPLVLAARSGAHPIEPCLDVAVPAFLAACARGGIRPEDPLRYRLLGVARDTLPLGEGTLTTAAYKGVQLSREGLQIELEDGQPVPLSLEAEAHRDAFEPHPKLARGQLCLHDTNPLWSLEEHPGKHGNATDLGGKEVGEWQRALDAALALIEVALPSLFAELESTLRRVVPVGYDSQRHLSASYTEAPGLIYMTLHPDPLTLAEAIIHETQHGKLNAVLWHDRVLHNGRSEWTTSPVRDDLRPLMGVLLAVHAFVPVSSLHAALAELDHPISQTNAFRLRRENVLASNADGLRTLYRLGQWTDLGARLRDAMTRMQDANVLRAPLPTPPQATA